MDSSEEVLIYGEYRLQKGISEDGGRYILILELFRPLVTDKACTIIIYKKPNWCTQRYTQQMGLSDTPGYGGMVDRKAETRHGGGS